MTIFEQFKVKWCHPDYPSKQILRDAVTDAEVELGVLFPNDYIELVTKTGLLSPTRGLLEVISNQEIDLADLSGMSAPEEVVSQTAAYRGGGMEDPLVLIANDCMGNVFGFDERELNSERPETATVYFWDHDFLETSKVADSVTDWIAAYVAINGNYDSWKDGDG